VTFDGATAKTFTWRTGFLRTVSAVWLGLCCVALCAGGVIELAPSGEAWVTWNLDRGSCLLICAIAGADGKPHFDAGMAHRFEL